MDLTPQQWERAKALFEDALEKPLAERTEFLTQSEPDAQVRNEVERLLAHHVESGGFLSRKVLPLTPARNGSETSHAFAPGDVVAARFRIVRFLARGGMGEVYEAEDLELRERVALKSIRGELLHDEKSLERFKREVHLARQVTHPNVCRIYELFRHVPASPSAGGGETVFVAMELLEGETLSEFLTRNPRMRAVEAQPIALQMAAGLGAAHAAGILHRDFKPGNVHLVPRGQGLRVVITDFGLALRSNRDLTISGTVTATGEVLGTPAYMSPEQVEGKDLTASSDVYSLGLVLYQMMTGTRAFEGSNPLATAILRLKEEPTPPHALVPDVDRRWESVILKCLSRDPKSRYQNGDAVGDALRGEGQRVAQWSKSALLGLAGIALVLLLLGGIALIPRLRHLSTQTETTATNSPTIAIRKSVAVLPLRNLSARADKDWVATALPEMLTAELAAGGKMRTFAGENIARASADLKLTGMQTLAPDTLERLWKYLGSDYVVLGSYLDQGNEKGGQVRVDLWLQEAKTGEIAATISEKGTENELDALATRAGAALRQKLGVGEVSTSDAALVRASLPSNADAQRLYSEGLAKLRVVDVLEARGLLERAVAADPNFALGHAALAEAWAAMGYDQKAQSESKKARDLSSGLSREERLWIEGNDWELNRKWDKAAEIYRTLFDFFPDNIDYGLRLAAAQRQARTVDESLATLEALRKLPAPNGQDPRISLQQADNFDVKGAYAQEQAATEAAANRARDLGETAVLARAYYLRSTDL